MKLAFKQASIFILLSCFTLSSYAINVSVQSASQGVVAIGFKANGVNHGGMGRSYTANSMPSGGKYVFGLRVNSVLSSDITCYDNKGRSAIPLTKDSSAVLIYSNNKCKVKIS